MSIIVLVFVTLVLAVMATVAFARRSPWPGAAFMAVARAALVRDQWAAVGGLADAGIAELEARANWRAGHRRSLVLRWLFAGWAERRRERRLSAAIDAARLLAESEARAQAEAARWDALARAASAAHFHRVAAREAAGAWEAECARVHAPAAEARERHVARERARRADLRAAVRGLGGLAFTRFDAFDADEGDLVPWSAAVEGELSFAQWAQDVIDDEGGEEYAALMRGWACA